MLNFSVIIPVYNRPQEIEELLQSLCLQTAKNFEVLIVEDGSDTDCKNIVDTYTKYLNIKYFYKSNSGPGTTRNYGAERATGDYFIFFDSDCIIPERYIEIVTKDLNIKYSDAYGGNDMAHDSFTTLQKAVNYSMTSFFTTGGIRGKKKSLDKFHPRSFNMGFSRAVFEKTKGFSTMRFGEDIDMSLRILENGFTTQLIPDASVYHKRRTDFRKFFKQVHNSGIARINLYKRHPQSLKVVHFLPALFLLGSVFILLSALVCLWALTLFVPFILIIFIDSLIRNKNIKVAYLSIVASLVQLYGYGSGFWIAFWYRIVLKKDEFHAFKTNFYK